MTSAKPSDEAPMKRKALIIALALLAAGLSVANLIDFMLSHLLDPVDHGNMIFGSAIAVLVLLGLSIGLTLRSFSNAIVAIVIAAMLLVGFLPRAVDAMQRQYQADRNRIENARIQEAFLAELVAQQKDVDARVAQHRAFSGEEAADLIAFVQSSDLSWRSLPDLSGTAFPLLERSLKAKILDPNSQIARNGQSAPVFVDFYNRNIRPTRTAIRVRDWKILELLIANGANLGIAEAQALSADLARKRIAEPKGFLRLE
jgi:type II secretory pathway pseudopilin PulG